MNTVCCIFIRAPTNGVHYFASNVTLQHMATQPILCNSVRSALPIYKCQVCQKCPLMKQRSNFLLHDNNCIILIANRIIYSWDHIPKALISPKITNANLNMYIFYVAITTVALLLQLEPAQYHQSILEHHLSSSYYK